MVDVAKNQDKLNEGKEQIKKSLFKDYATVETAIGRLKDLVDRISPRFTKKYSLFEDEKSYFK